MKHEMVEEKNELTQFAKDFDRAGAYFDHMLGKFKALRSAVVNLENRREHLRKEVASLHSQLGKVEEDIKTKMYSVENGSKALVDAAQRAKVSAQNDRKQAEEELKAAQKARREAEMLLAGARTQARAINEVSDAVADIKAKKKAVK